jgi:hypothetical protein
MIHKFCDTRDHFGSQNLPVDSVMKFTVTVRTGRQGVVHGVRSTFGECSDVMNLHEMIAIGPLERCLFLADLTGTIRLFEDPGDYVWVANKSLHCSNCLFASR